MSQYVVPPGADAQELCGPYLIALPITGALVTVLDGVGLRSGVAVTDPVAARWDELELELGCGPLTDAGQRSTVERVHDVGAETLNPLLAEGLIALGIRAVVALPLIVGSATIGVAGLYRTRAGALTARELDIALAITRAITVPTIRIATRLAENAAAGDPDERGGLRREVHQATGMISALLDLPMTDAFAWLRAAATTRRRSINAVALDIVTGDMDVRSADDDD